MAVTRKKLRLGEMLIEGGLLDNDKLQKALLDSRRTGLKLGQQLIRDGLVKESEVVDLVSRQMSLERYNPRNYEVDSSLSSLLPADLAMKHKVAPLAKKGYLLTVAMTDPMDLGAIDAIEIYTNSEVEPVICLEKELAQLTATIYGASAGLGGVMESMEGMRVDAEAEEESGEIQVGSLHDMAGEAPVVRLVNSILSQAIREGASDVHISPEKNTTHIRFRVDGKLKDVPSPPKSMLLPIISRIKILAKLDISISRIPQDGRFSLRMEQKEINVRASTLPTIHGENVVLRLLDMSSGGLTLSDLGMAADDFERVRDSIIRPYGMILSTGPTGSGKSTSLYAILREINTPDVNIITLEDPVEYRVDGIRQVQLNRKAGMTFASGLRSILRQDPDVVMVGEIRDAETASIAVQAALTGHRVFSTVHTNDAAGAMTRFMDMGIEPFLISSVMLLSFAQRLVRTVCPHCREPYNPEPEMLRYWGLGNDSGQEFLRGKGCYMCGNTGYKGRTGVFEVLKVDDEVKEMILRRDSALEITRFATQSGRMRLLKDDAKAKILRGQTTLEEAASAVMV